MNLKYQTVLTVDSLEKQSLVFFYNKIISFFTGIIELSFTTNGTPHCHNFAFIPQKYTFLFVCTFNQSSSHRLISKSLHCVTNDKHYHHFLSCHMTNDLSQHNGSQPFFSLQQTFIMSVIWLHSFRSQIRANCSHFCFTTSFFQLEQGLMVLL